jgi:stage II sporulation protein D
MKTNDRRRVPALFFCALVAAGALAGALLIASCAGERPGVRKPEAEPPMTAPEQPVPVPVPPVERKPEAQPQTQPQESPVLMPMLDRPPVVRVLVLEARRSLRVRIPAPFEAGPADGNDRLDRIDREGEFFVRPNGDEASLVQGKRRVVSAAAILIRPQEGTKISIEGKPYRGSFVFKAARGGILTINVVDIEDYIKGVLPSEIGYLKPNQYAASCAQAIAARSYALSKLNDTKGGDYDLNATVMDQVYRGASCEHDISSHAVDETRGYICSFVGQPVRTYYSACCGGHTADIRVGWPWKTPYPYLYGVRDTVPGTYGASLCHDSKSFRWRVHWSGTSLAGVLKRTLPAELKISPRQVGHLEDIRVLGVSADGRVTGIEIVTDRGVYQVLGDRIRWVLKPDPGSDAILKSTLFKMEISRMGDRVASVDMLGGGNGHGIGMCQTGAIRMAELGYSPKEILHHYYPGARIQKLYP